MAAFACAAFDIDARTGFLPAQAPLRRLPGQYERWEELLDFAMHNISTPGASPTITPSQRAISARWRKRVCTTPVLSCFEIEQDLRQSQRAHHVLAYLTQFYVQSLPSPSEAAKSADIRIPAPIAVPFVAVSRCLGIAPIVTYADTVLWNWEKRDPNLPLSRSNIRICDLFTGSPQEEHFFLTSARIEVRGWEALDAMENCVNETDSKSPDTANMVHHLGRLASSLDDITAILLAVKEGLDPDFFYNKFRPWIQGADQGPNSSSWFYEGVDGFGLTLQPSGPSAGQSALMHSFDAFLGVPHPHSKNGLGGGCTRFNAALNPHNTQLDKPHLPVGHPPVPGALHLPPSPPVTPKCLPRELDEEVHVVAPSKPSVDTSFNARMRSYMTEAHQGFLVYLEKHSIGSFVSSSTSREVTEAYNSCVMALKRWRDAHILVVTQFVIIPARSLNGANEPGVRPCIIDNAGNSVPLERKPVRGTGGTSLIPLLKIYRNNTLARVHRIFT